MRVYEEPGSSPEAHASAAHRREDQAASALAAMAAGAPGAVRHPAVLHLQRAAGNASVTGLLAGDEEQESPVKGVVGSGGGQPLDRDTRGFMESRLGHDFSDVRIHTDANASESAKSVQAHAYTVGNDIVFQGGQYAPDTAAGKRTLAHELTHVVQQRSGPVDGTPAPGGITVSDPSDAFERAAERSADQAMAGGPTNVAAPAPASIQRQDAEDEVQESAVQRQAEPPQPEEEQEEEQAAPPA